MTTTVFLESLDSTRATSTESPEHPNLAQAQAEALISLLLGRTVTVSGSYVLDSCSFLELAEVVLDTRARVRAESRSGRERLDAAAPFLLSWYAVPNKPVHDLRTACVEQLNRIDADGRFVLSAWRAIDEDAGTRHAVADALLAGPGAAAPRGLDHDLARRLAALMRVLDHGESEDRCRQARGPVIDLHGYLSRFATLDRAAVDGLAERSACSRELAHTLREEIASRGSGLRSRSWAHEAIMRAARFPDPSLAVLVRELVDTCYNAVIADSCDAATGYLSSVPRVDARVELKQVNALATGLIELTNAELRAEAAGERAVAPQPSPVSGVFAPAELLPHLDPTPLGVLFEAYWRLIADEDAHHAWSDSCRSLAEQLDEPGGGPGFGEAWESHLDMLRLTMPGVVVERGWLGIGAAHQGGRYVQTHQLGDADPGLLRHALSAGEYLDQLAHTHYS